MDTLEIEAHRIARAVQHRGYVIEAWAQRDSSMHRSRGSM
jgi:hypothetical protein